MTKINVTFADESAKNIVVHTSMSYEMPAVRNDQGQAAEIER
jgi:hypothetical protein